MKTAGTGVFMAGTLFLQCMSLLLAHRDRRRFDGQAPLSGHCGHGPIFIAQRSVANDPELTSEVQLFCAAKSLFDHLIGTQQDRLRRRQTERLRGLEVHDHLEFCRKLHREIARLCATQYAIDISRSTTRDIYHVWSVGEQTAVSDKLRRHIDRRYVVSGRPQYELHAMREREYIRYEDKAASRLAPKGDHGRFDFCVSINGRNDCLEQ